MWAKKNKRKRKKKLTREQIIKKKMRAIDKKAMRDVRNSCVPNTTFWNKGK